MVGELIRRRRATLVFVAAAATLASVPGGALPPLPKEVPTPILSYDGPGFAVNLDGRLYAVARNGTEHGYDLTGRIALYEFSDGVMQWPPIPLIDSEFDDRNPAGGVTRSGALIVFYARSSAENEWVDLRVARFEGQERSDISLPTWPDSTFAPYGPLVVLPSGRLMQTVYGWGRRADGRFYSRVRAFFSNDDGRTWPEQRIIWESFHEFPTETAAAYIDGSSDAGARLIAVSRSWRYLNGKPVAYLMQHTSVDGGKTWRRQGWIGGPRLREAVPWVAGIGGGRVVLAIGDRDSWTVNVCIASAGRVFSDPTAWPKNRAIYRSTLDETERIRINEEIGQTIRYGDFGYPSIVQFGPMDYQKLIVFFDSHTGDSGWEPLDAFADTDLLRMHLFAVPLDER